MTGYRGPEIQTDEQFTNANLDFDKERSIAYMKKILVMTRQ